MKKSVFIVLLTILLAMPQSCENSYSIYSGKYRVNYIFNPNTPPLLRAEGRGPCCGRLP